MNNQSLNEPRKDSCFNGINIHNLEANVDPMKIKDTASKIRNWVKKYTEMLPKDDNVAVKELLDNLTAASDIAVVAAKYGSLLKKKDLDLSEYKQIFDEASAIGMIVHIEDDGCNWVKVYVRYL